MGTQYEKGVIFRVMSLSHKVITISEEVHFYPQDLNVTTKHHLLHPMISDEYWCERYDVNNNLIWRVRRTAQASYRQNESRWTDLVGDHRQARDIHKSHVIDLAGIQMDKHYANFIFTHLYIAHKRCLFQRISTKDACLLFKHNTRTICYSNDILLWLPRLHQCKHKSRNKSVAFYAMCLWY